MKLCIESNYFKCDGKFYKTSTCPIGSPLSPCSCLIFMEELENSVLKKASGMIRLWRRYVDDTLAVEGRN